VIRVNTTGTVTPVQNALDSLRRVARELEGADPEDPLALKGALAWGWHRVVERDLTGAFG
jgi:hypothetical protein